MPDSFCTVDHSPDITLLSPALPHEMHVVRDIFQEYADTLDVDLSFQNFAQELATLPGEYAPPRGHILLAEVEAALPGAAPCGRWTPPTTPTPAR